MIKTDATHLSLSVLKRIDDLCSEIVDSASHVAVYDFSERENKWERRECEGTLFVIKRNGNPRFKLIVLNRLNLENLIVDVTYKMDLEDHDPYLIFRDRNTKYIIGLWFHDGKERAKISALLARIKHALGKIAVTLSSPKEPNSVSNTLVTETSKPKDDIISQFNEKLFKQKMEENAAKETNRVSPSSTSLPPPLPSPKHILNASASSSGSGGGGGDTFNFRERIENYRDRGDTLTNGNKKSSEVTHRESTYTPLSSAALLSTLTSNNSKFMKEKESPIPLLSPGILNSKAILPNHNRDNNFIFNNNNNNNNNNSEKETEKTSSPYDRSSISEKVELTKLELQMILMKLIKEDHFIEMLHREYLANNK